VLGTGLGGLADDIAADVENPLRRDSALPVVHGPVAQRPAGLRHFWRGKPVIAMEGRFHFYEGYDLPAHHLFRCGVMRALGTEVLVVSNACGGMNPQWKPRATSC